MTAAQAKARSKNARYGGYEDSILQDKAPLCPGHQQPSKLKKVNKSGPNKGRKFYSCCMDQDQQCKFFLWAEDNPSLIALTLADNAATAERDRLLGPEEAKRAAAVRSFCHKVSLLTRSELQREIQKFKKRREQCAYLDINSGSRKEMKKEQDKGRRKNKNKNKNDQLFPLTVGGNRQELLDLLEQEATRLIHHSDSISEGVTGGKTVGLKTRVAPCADSDEEAEEDEGAVGGRDAKRGVKRGVKGDEKRDVKGDERRGERRDVRKRGVQSVVVKKIDSHSDDDNSVGDGEDDSENYSEDDSDSADNSSSGSIEVNSSEDEEEEEEEEEEEDEGEEEDESDIDIVEEELKGDEKLFKSEQMIMLSSDEEDSVPSSPSSPSYSGRCKKRKLSASVLQGVEGNEGKDTESKGVNKKKGIQYVEGGIRVEGVDGRNGSSSSTALRPIDVALRSCFGYSSFRPGQR